MFGYNKETFRRWESLADKMRDHIVNLMDENEKLRHENSELRMKIISDKFVRECKGK